LYLPIIAPNNSQIYQLSLNVQQPVILTDTHLIEPALGWSLDYLKENIGNGLFAVYESSNHLFKYFDDKKLSSHSDFKPQMKRLEMTFTEFCDRLKVPQNDRKRLLFSFEPSTN